MGLYDDVLKPSPAPKSAPRATPAAPRKGLYDDVLKAEPAKSAAAPADPTATAWDAPIEHAIDSAGRTLNRVGHAVDRHLGGVLSYGHQHAYEPFINATTAPQRGLQELEVGADSPQGIPGDLRDVWHAMVTPAMGPELSRKVKGVIGLSGLEAGPLAGNSLLKKTARGVLDTGLDIANDPMNVVPVGKVLEMAGKGVRAIPGVQHAAQAVANSKVGEGTSYVFNPDHYMRGLSPQAKAAFEAATNRAMEVVRNKKIVEDAIVKKHAADIRRGVLPDEVRDLFSPTKNRGVDETIRGYFPEGIKPGTRPQDVQKALFSNRAPDFQNNALADINRDALGIFDSPHTAHLKGAFTVPEDKVAEVQARLRKSIQSKFNPDSQNPILRAARYATHRGNQAFLANPLPHVGNLADLAKNRYGYRTMAQGLINAARVATGKTGKRTERVFAEHDGSPARYRIDPDTGSMVLDRPAPQIVKGSRLADTIAELEAGGAHSQYGNIFDELGLTRIAGIPRTEGAARAVNKAIIPLQRLSNAAQNKVLNSAETGLRAAALDAEKKKGVATPQAMRNIHSAFGTDAPNGLTQGAASIGTPFPKFHIQTAPGSVLRTLATNPQRITNTQKAQRDMNAQINPHGAQYRSTVPSASAARMVDDPLGYFGSVLGPIAQAQNAFGPLTELQKGKITAALVGAGGGAGEGGAMRLVPGTPEFAALIEGLRHHKSKSGASGLQDAGASLLGGFYGKK